MLSTLILILMLVVFMFLVYCVIVYSDSLYIKETKKPKGRILSSKF